MAAAYLTEGLAPRALKPQGSFSVSPEDIAELDGSVWEWTQECYAGVEDGVNPCLCPAYSVGGEHVAAMSFLERDPASGVCAVGTAPAHLRVRFGQMVNMDLLACTGILSRLRMGLFNSSPPPFFRPAVVRQN